MTNVIPFPARQDPEQAAVAKATVVVVDTVREAMRLYRAGDSKAAKERYLQGAGKIVPLAASWPENGFLNGLAATMNMRAHEIRAPRRPRR